MKTHIAKLNYLNVTPRKVRLVANLIKGSSVAEAQAQLLVMPQRSAPAILKFLRSAIDGAKKKDFVENKLKIANIIVNEGPRLKRSMPRAQGRATLILKRMSHISLTLIETETEAGRNFVITKPEKKTKKEIRKTGPKKSKSADDKPEKESIKKGAKKEGGLKRFFRRKSV